MNGQGASESRAKKIPDQIFCLYRGFLDLNLFLFQRPSIAKFQESCYQQVNICACIVERQGWSNSSLLTKSP